MSKYDIFSNFDESRWGDEAMLDEIAAEEAAKIANKAVHLPKISQITKITHNKSNSRRRRRKPQCNPNKGSNATTWPRARKV